LLLRHSTLSAQTEPVKKSILNLTNGPLNYSWWFPKLQNRWPLVHCTRSFCCWFRSKICSTNLVWKLTLVTAIDSKKFWYIIKQAASCCKLGKYNEFRNLDKYCWVISPGWTGFLKTMIILMLKTEWVIS
jgi:hypothetical protein